MSTPTRIAFISGPIDASQDYFDAHYKSRIDSAVAAGDDFVLGPVLGIDSLALDYLLQSHVPPSKITIYPAHFEYSDVNLRQRFQELGVGVKCVGDVGALTSDRDAKMTEESDYDILRYKTEEEARAMYGDGWFPKVTATEMNERRRKGIVSQAYTLNGDAGKDDDAPISKKRSMKERILRVFRW